MASITIRNLDDQLKETLRIEAAHNGHSMEEEVRSILKRALRRRDDSRGFGSRVHARFSAIGGVDLELPPRSEPPRGAVIEE